MKKRGQVWVETVIYTLIGFALIAMVFAFARPKIQEMQNEIVIKNSINSLEQIDLKVKSVVQAGLGNRRIEEIKVNLGKFVVDAQNDSLYFQFEVDKPYSQEGLEIKGKVVNLITLNQGIDYLVKTTLNLSNYNLTLNNKEQVQFYFQSNVPYELFITYVENINSIPQINLEVK